jgi:hypothetical protein
VGGPLVAVTRALTGAVVVALLMLPSVAPAQEPGVFVDPDSPAGKEYVIPLEEARRQAAGEEQRGAGAARAGDSGGQPLFGAGIERVTGESPAGGKGRDGGGSGATGRDNGSDREASDDGQSNGTRSVAVEAAATGGSDAAVTAAIVGLVLAGGLGVGFGLRRLLRTD